MKKELTKAEEQIMQYLWQIKKGFVKDIVEKFPEPKPAYTTITTVIRILADKGFIGYNTYGKIHEYFPLIEKKDYASQHLKTVVKNYFNGSKKKLVSFFADDEDITLNELEELKNIVDSKIKNIKKNKND